jgi:hypothetical protein
VKKALQEASISLPDPAREVILPRGVEVTIAHDDTSHSESGPEALPVPAADGESAPPAESARISRMAEGELQSDVPMMKQQAANSRQVEEGPDLLTPAAHSNGNGHPMKPA